MNSMKRIVSLALALIMVLTLAGVALASEPVELDFWDMTWGPTEYISTAEKLVEEFNASHPNIKVKYQSTPWSNWYQTFATAIASGTAPDISTGAGYQAFQFAQIDAILPIDDLVEEMRAAGELAAYPDSTIEPLKVDGKQIAFPWNQDIRVMWYNKTLLDQAGVQPPTTWEEFRAAAKAVSELGDDIYGLSLGAAQTSATHIMLTMLINNGGGLFDEDRNVFIAGNERNKETFQFFYDLAADGSINPAAAGYTGDDAERAFVSGKAAFMLSNAGLNNKYPELDGQIFICDPLAGFHGDKATLKWINNIMIYASTEHPAEAKEFLRWWALNEKPLFTEGRLTSLPVNTDFAQDPFFTENPLVNKALQEFAPIGKTTASNCPYIFAELNEIEGDTFISNTMQGLIMQQDVDMLLEALQGSVEEVMAKSAS